MGRKTRQSVHRDWLVTSDKKANSSFLTKRDQDCHDLLDGQAASGYSVTFSDSASPHLPSGQLATARTPLPDSSACLWRSASRLHRFFDPIELQLLAARIVIDDDLLAVAHLTFKDQPRQRCLDFLLDGTLQGACAIRRVIADAYRGTPVRRRSTRSAYGARPGACADIPVGSRRFV